MDAQVVVVGCGPVGALAGVLLGERGVDTLVVEKTSDVYPVPRAAYVHGDVARILHRVGVWGALGDTTAPVRGLRFVDASHETLLHLRATAAASDVRPSGFVFHQPTLERELRRRLHTLPSVTLRTGCEATHITQDARGVDVHLSANASASECIRTAFVVGCDGAHSPTRTACGIELEQLGPSTPWLVIDALATHPERLPETPMQVCDPRQPSTYVPFAGRHRRWEFMLTPAEANLTAHNALARDRLRDWVNPSELDVQRIAVYRFHALLADRWRRGRVFLAGDAAHQMPPFLGQGMGAGMRDAANLGWKLDAVLAGDADASTLDSYEAERRPHVRAVVRRSQMAGAVIQTRTPWIAALRDTAFRVVNRSTWLRERIREAAAQTPALGGTSVWERRRGVGTLIPPTTLRDARGRRTSLDALLGPGPTVITRSGATTVRVSGTGKASGADAATQWRDAEEALLRWMDAHGVSRVTIRPDGYVDCVQ